MSQSKTKAFYTTEALPLWKKLKGPAYLAGKLEIVGLINTFNMFAAQLLAYVQRGKFSPFDEMNVSLMQEAGEPTDGWL
jgi:hypothetical protein